MAFGRKKATDNEDDVNLEAELATLRSILAHYPPATLLHFGSPSRCPDCGDYGMVERTNHADGACVNHCRVCRRDWIVTLRALRAYRNAPEPPSHPSGRASDPAKVPPDPSINVSDRPGAALGASPAAAEPTPSYQDRPASKPPDATREPIGAGVTPHLSVTDAPLRLLVVEDNPFDLAVIEELLEPSTATSQVELAHFATRQQAELATQSTRFDVVLLDLDLPDSNGLTTVLEWQHHLTEELPLIALVDEPDPELIRRARSVGVVTVIQKAHLEKLATQGETGQKRLLKLLRNTAAERKPTGTIRLH